jgi:hypothetical protein
MQADKLISIEKGEIASNLASVLACKLASVKTNMALLIIISAWSFSILNMLHIINSMDMFDSLLLGITATVFSVRYSIRQKNNGNGKKKLSI